MIKSLIYGLGIVNLQTVLSFCSLPQINCTFPPKPLALHKI